MTTVGLSKASIEDCKDTAALLLISSDGLAAYIWEQTQRPGESLKDVGARRYARAGVDFSSEEFCESVLLVQVREDLLDHQRILDAGNDPGVATASSAGFNVDIDKSARQPVCTAAGCPNGCGTGKCRMHTRFKRCA